MLATRAFLSLSACHTPGARLSGGAVGTRSLMASAGLGSNGRRFAVCFDIDGVLRRGPGALPGAAQALLHLRRLNVPHVLITNGGGVPEEMKAKAIEKLLATSVRRELEEPHELRIDPEQMILAHTPMRELANELQDTRVMVMGCREEIRVAKSYGFKKVVSPEEFAAQHPKLYTFCRLPHPEPDPFADEPIGAIVIMHDPVHWHLELQVCCDVLQGIDPLGERFLTARTKPLVGHIPVFNSNEDFVFSSDYEHPRFAQGAFLDCLELLFNKVSGGKTLNVHRYGKPRRSTFDFAHQRLLDLSAQLPGGNPEEPHKFDKIYMVGDNPAADIRGANDAGEPWHSILVRTGVYSGTEELDPREKPHTQVENVAEALDYILAQELR